MDVKNTHSVTKTEISVFGRQALGSEIRRSPSLAVKVLIDARTSPLPVRVPPAARVRPRLRSSSQHSNSCATTSAPVNFVPSLYSFQRVTKYAHSSPVPASNTDGRFSLSARALVDGAIAVAVCAVAWMFRRAAVTTASSFSASNVQSGNGHLTFTML